MPINFGVGGRRFLQGTTAIALSGPGVSSPAGVETPPLVVTRYELARTVSKDPRWRRQPATGTTLIGPASSMSITEMDPPRHTSIRGLLARLFSRSRVRALESRARQRAGELCDRLLDAGPPADLIEKFCEPFTFAVQCDLLGVPEHARRDLREVALRRSGRTDATPREVYDAEIALHAQVAAILGELEHSGGEGAYIELIRSHRDGVFDAHEMTGLASSLLFDGHLLSGAQIANIVATLLCYSHIRAGALHRDGLAPTAREELLRWSPAITLGMPRRASECLPLAGAVVAEGQTVVVAFGCTNRDPTVFDRPTSVDLTREPNKHLTFGYGTHYCLGAHLARLEIDVAISELFSRLPRLSLAVDERQLVWSASHTIRRLLSLPVIWRPQRASHRERPEPACRPSPCRSLRAHTRASSDLPLPASPVRAFRTPHGG